MTGQVAVLSYHGWEIDPDRLADDVGALRADGWRDCSLADLDAMASGVRPCDRRYFHVTLDDGADEDRACVDALRGLSCPATLFIPLDAMTASAREAYRRIVEGADASGIAVADHSLRHNRAFHTRRVLGFHADAKPLMTSPERLGLAPGDPVCAYGGEIARPRFTPADEARAWCRAMAAQVEAAPGSAAWTDALAASLIGAKLGFRRLGRLCVAGQYETRDRFHARIAGYLREGRDRLAAFTGSAPIAFAHPWWQPSPAADACLRALGYRLTFSGRGLWHGRGSSAIPRLFVSNGTARPLAPDRIDVRGSSPLASRVRDAGRRALWA